MSFSQGLYLYTNTEKRTQTQTLTDHGLASENSACLRPFSYRDRQVLGWMIGIVDTSLQLQPIITAHDQ
jgi:hypothetical protein